MNRNGIVLTTLMIGMLLLILTPVIMSQNLDRYQGEEKSRSIITSVPRTMSYQGHLNDDGGQPVTDTLDITFRLYDVETGGSPLWDEVVADVPIIDGSFSAELGETNSIDLSFDTQYWMGLQVEGDPDEMTPRLKLHMSPYSAVTDSSDFAAYSDFSDFSAYSDFSNFAIDSDFLDGFDSGDFALVGHTHPGQGNGWIDDGTVVRLETADVGGNSTLKKTAMVSIIASGTAYHADN